MSEIIEEKDSEELSTKTKRKSGFSWNWLELVTQSVWNAIVWIPALIIGNLFDGD